MDFDFGFGFGKFEFDPLNDMFSANRFIDAWMGRPTLSDVAKALDVTPEQARQWADDLRAMGVILPPEPGEVAHHGPRAGDPPVRPNRPDAPRPNRLDDDKPTA